MCSFSEAVSRRLATACPEELVNYNKTWLSRVYPSGKRVGSSNYNPQEMWNCGCQLGKDLGIWNGLYRLYLTLFLNCLVALNYQTPGIMMHLNTGKFLENGECGYVLKPSVMRDGKFVLILFVNSLLFFVELIDRNTQQTTLIVF